jgi:hypothetical protein
MTQTASALPHLSSPRPVVPSLDTVVPSLDTVVPSLDAVARAYVAAGGSPAARRCRRAGVAGFTRRFGDLDG